MKLLKSVCVLPLMGILVACEKVGDRDAPVIEDVFTQVVNYHPSYVTKHGVSDNIGSVFGSVAIRVSDVDGIDNLATMNVSNSTNGTSISLLERVGGDPVGAHFDTINNVFLDVFDTERGDRVDIHDWRVTVTDLQGYDTTGSFEFALFNDSGATTEQFVYTPSYSGDTSEGVSAMAAMTVVDNSISFTEDAANQQFIVSFDNAEAGAANYEIWFYDTSLLGTLSSNIIELDESAKGVLKSDASAIQDNPIVSGSASLTIDWDDIEFDVGARAVDMDGIHIVLHDLETTSFPSNSDQWFTQSSISEYVDLTL